jgi:hypothetical protein
MMNVTSFLLQNLPETLLGKMMPQKNNANRNIFHFVAKKVMSLFFYFLSAFIPTLGDLAC